MPAPWAGIIAGIYRWPAVLSPRATARSRVSGPFACPSFTHPWASHQRHEIYWRDDHARSLTTPGILYEGSHRGMSCSHSYDQETEAASPNTEATCTGVTGGTHSDGLRPIMNVPARGGSTMPGTQRAPGRTSDLSKDKSSGHIAKFLGKSWWTGISAIAAVLAIGVAVVIAILPSNQHGTQITSISPVRFNDLSETTIPRFGFSFFQPSDWDQQYLPDNGDGAKFVNPDDKAVSITGSGVHLWSPRYPTILDVEKEWRSQILSLRKARIIEGTPTGATVKGNNWQEPIDAWRVTFQYVNDRGRSMTDMVKTAYANGREVDLVMEAPTREFPRYKQAFLRLSDQLLLLARCLDCSAN